MVWFQCEDCGENLKKPKLPNHFRICSASKFSCIDCGVTFGQQSVQAHTQCITEAEKYGPKGQGQAKVPNGSNIKPNKETKQQSDIDINVGLSDRPPWFCSLCNTKATSKQTLLLHAEGKKHRAKARAFHANQQPKQTEESAPDTNVPTGKMQNGELAENKNDSTVDPKLQDLSKDDSVNINPGAANGNLHVKKKRKLEASDKDTFKSVGDDKSSEAGNGEVIQVEREKVEVTESKLKKERKLKWKKLITSALKSSPDGVLKMRKLRKLVLKALRELGMEEDETHINEILEHKIATSSRFAVDNKYVRLVAGD